MPDEGQELARVGAGQCFGELALLHSEGRAANVMALEDAQVCCALSPVGRLIMRAPSVTRRFGGQHPHITPALSHLAPVLPPPFCPSFPLALTL